MKRVMKVSIGLGLIALSFTAFFNLYGQAKVEPVWKIKQREENRACKADCITAFFAFT